MMIVVAHLKVSGAFRALGALAMEHAHAPFVLLITVTVLTGVMSAFLVNDAICLVMTPIVMQVVRALDRNPLPYLVAVATASNCGSVATITGNPQNMVIGALSRIPTPRSRPRSRLWRPSASSPSSSRFASFTLRNSRRGARSSHTSLEGTCMPARSSRRASSASRLRSPSSPARRRRKPRFSAARSCW